MGRRAGEAFKAENLVTTVKHEGDFIMAWTCISAIRSEEMFVCQGRMNSATYLFMLLDGLESSFAKLHPRVLKNNFSAGQCSLPHSQE